MIVLHQYPTPINQEWLLSVHQAQLRKIATNVTPISQERQLLSNWLTSRSPSTQGRGQLTLRVFAQEVRIVQGVHANPSTTPDTRGVANNNETTSIIEVATNIIRIGHPQAYFTDKRPRIIPYSTVSTIKYERGRLLKDHSSMKEEYLEKENTTIQSLPPSPQPKII